MNIAGIQKTTLVDFPGMVAATVFTRGCTFSCHFCHNPELVLPKQFNPLIPEKDFFDFLESRLGKLGGICITGGEPTIHPDLPEFISHIQAMGFKVKLDTNGSNSRMLEHIIKDGDVDYIAMDVKSPAAKYAEITNPKSQTLNKSQISNVKSSIKLIMRSKILYEFRTTVAKPLHSVEDMEDIGKLIDGAEKYFIQNYEKSKQINEGMELEPFSRKELGKMAKIIEKYVKNVEVR